MSETACRDSAQGDDLLLLGVTTGRNRSAAKTVTKSLFFGGPASPGSSRPLCSQKLVRSGASMRFVLTGSVALRFP